MTDAIEARQQLQASIDADITARIKNHQARIARLKAGHLKARAAGGPQPAQPLVMLAHGDSWFDYPLNGNAVSLSDTDIIAQLQTMGNVNPMIANVSHYGDATTDEMSLPKQQRMMQQLQDPANWMTSGKPDAILFSGGGDDIVGDQFCIYLDYAAAGGTGLDMARYQMVLASVEARFEDLFAFRDQYAPGVPIFGHCYDFPIPNGAHPICAGPWLQPSLVFCGYTDVARGTAIVHDALVQFRTLLVKLATPANNFFMVDTQGTLVTADWANELHPFPGGFVKLAQKFVDVLRVNFPGRI
jgi:hypothetical protein